MHMPVLAAQDRCAASLWTSSLINLVFKGAIMHRLPVIRNLPIRYKMLLSYSTVFILSITISSAVIYSIVRDTIKANIESELKNTSAAILNMVQISASVAIKNHLRAVAEKNLEIVRYHYDLYLKGLLSETEARKRAKGMLLAQQIGVTGYIACVDSHGIMKIHPRSELEGVDFSDRAFIREMIRRKQGYIEYRWMNLRCLYEATGGLQPKHSSGNCREETGGSGAA